VDIDVSIEAEEPSGIVPNLLIVLLPPKAALTHASQWEHSGSSNTGAMATVLQCINDGMATVHYATA